MTSYFCLLKGMIRIVPWRLAVFLLLLNSFASGIQAYIVADQNSVAQFDHIPDYWIEQAKQIVLIHTGQSHGRQIPYGLMDVETDIDSKYDAEVVFGDFPPSSGALGVSRSLKSSNGFWMDYADTTDFWDGEAAMDNVRRTLDYQSSQGIDVDAILHTWSWDFYTETTFDKVDRYFLAMEQLESEYPNTTFIYMTDTSDRLGDQGYNRWVNHERIRQYVKNTDKTLFDFGWMETWSEDLSEQNTFYHSGSGLTIPVWHDDWHVTGMGSDGKGYVGPLEEGACHINKNACIMKAKAMWWLMARLAGWDGTTGGTGSGVYYVDGANGNDADDGQSWDTAKATIQAAITAAGTDDEIWVKAGTYTISSQIFVDEPIGIYGGFVGDETERSQRDWALNTTTIDGQNTTRIFETPDEPIIDGFTLTNGYYDTTSAQSGGGAIYLGGIGSGGKSARISNCIISNNTVDADSTGFSIKGGGAIYVGAGDPVFVNCLITNNSTNAYGGGANLYSGSPDFINCTISKNTALKGGGFCLQGVDTTLNAEFYNCIVSGNTGTSDANDLFVRATGDPPQGSNNCSSDEIGTGTILADPLFIDPDSDDFHLRAGSPCIDAGDSNSVPSDVSDLDGDVDLNEPVPLGLDGGPRFIDDPNAANTGGGPPPIVDIGAYEFGELHCGGPDRPYPVGDINADCAVDTLDFMALANAWLSEPNSPGWNVRCDIAPDGGDGVINSKDFTTLATQWQEGVPSVKAGVNLDNQWMYQSLPDETDSTLTASEVIFYDPLDNNEYTHSWEYVPAADADVLPATVAGGESSDVFWTFAAPDCDEPQGLSDSGLPFKVKVTITGLQYGNTGTAEADFGIALLGDVNNDGVVNVADRSIINAFWRTGAAGSFTLKDCDLNCDGAVSVADRSIANTIWRGVLGQNFVSTPCMFR